MKLYGRARFQFYENVEIFIEISTGISTQLIWKILLNLSDVYSRSAEREGENHAHRGIKSWSAGADAKTNINSIIASPPALCFKPPY